MLKASRVRFLFFFFFQKKKAKADNTVKSRGKVAQSDSGQVNFAWFMLLYIFVNVRESSAVHAKQPQIKARNAIENKFREQRLFSMAL